MLSPCLPFQRGDIIVCAKLKSILIFMTPIWKSENF